jgi:ubiquinone/menaquinone biosynthesis C-methylase UbiE
MEAKLQRRLQRSGWDLAAGRYETLWAAGLAAAHEKTIACAALRAGDRVLDVACGSGLVSLAAARIVGPTGAVTGTDLSGRMVDVAAASAASRGLRHAAFMRMDAEALSFGDASFDAAMCSLGLMYVPDTLQAVREMRRVTRPGGRIVLTVWGDRSRCGWADLFDIVDAEVESEVCPLFFRLGHAGALSQLCEEAGLGNIEIHRISSSLFYDGVNEACSAAFVGGPAALAWSRFDDETRERVCDRYLESIKRWRVRDGYRLPAEFVVARAIAPG